MFEYPFLVFLWKPVEQQLMKIALHVENYTAESFDDINGVSLFVVGGISFSESLERFPMPRA